MLGAAWGLEKTYGFGQIHGFSALGWGALMTGGAVTIVILFWAVKSLPVAKRGNKLVTTGAFRYFRHPLYAAFLLGAGPGLVIYLDGWPYLAVGFSAFPLWHWNVRGEEAMMASIFPDDYPAYCQKTGRFFPKLW